MEWVVSRDATKLEEGDGSRTEHPISSVPLLSLSLSYVSVPFPSITET